MIVKNLIGDDGGGDFDLIEGDDQNNHLKGTTNAEIIFGYGGNDTLEADDGDDYLYGGEGNDILRGGRGDDSLTDETGDNLLEGNDGDDLLVSGSGNDTLTGGNGNDILQGGDGINQLFGDAGDDTLWAIGSDNLTGGDGIDTFIFGAQLNHFQVLDFDLENDILLFYTSQYGIEDVNQLLQYITNINQRIDGVTVEFGSDASIELVGINLNDITIDMISFW
jgi:Ca2+-binding RTX toxin-like protein